MKKRQQITARGRNLAVYELGYLSRAAWDLKQGCTPAADDPRVQISTACFNAALYLTSGDRKEVAEQIATLGAVSIELFPDAAMLSSWQWHVYTVERHPGLKPCPRNVGISPRRVLDEIKKRADVELAAHKKAKHADASMADHGVVKTEVSTMVVANPIAGAVVDDLIEEPLVAGEPDPDAAEIYEKSRADAARYMPPDWMEMLYPPRA